MESIDILIEEGSGQVIEVSVMLFCDFIWIRCGCYI